MKSVYTLAILFYFQTDRQTHRHIGMRAQVNWTYCYETEIMKTQYL